MQTSGKKLTTKQFNHLVQQLRSDMDRTMERKGREYATDEVRLLNLHAHALMERRAAHLVALTFLNKHVVALNQLLARGDTVLRMYDEHGGEKVLSRLVDILAWTHLLHGTLVEAAPDTGPKKALITTKEVAKYPPNDEGGFAREPEPCTK